MRDSLLDWADDHGYVHCICPRCHRHFWTDSGDPCPSGCFDDEYRQKEEKRLAEEEEQRAIDERENVKDDDQDEGGDD